MTDQITKDEFNQLCASIMGYKDFDLDLLYDRNYNPYEDLNHMEDVVEKLIVHHEKFEACVSPLTIAGQGIKQAMRDFIISTVDGKVS